MERIKQLTESLELVGENKRKQQMIKDAIFLIILDFRIIIAYNIFR